MNWTNSSTTAAVTMADVLATCKVMYDRAAQQRAAFEHKVFEFDGTLAELKAELERQGVITDDAPPGGVSSNPGVPFPVMPELEVHEVNGNTVVGTAAGLERWRRKLHATLALTGYHFRSSDD